MLFRVLCILLLWLAASLTQADEGELVAPSIFNQSGSFYFYLGDFDAEITPVELENPSSEFAFGLGALFDYEEHIDWGIDLLLVSRQYDTPATVSGGPLTIVSDEMTVDTFGITVNMRFKFPAGSFVWYAGAGTGVYFSKLTLTASTLGLPGTHEEKSNDFGYAYYWGMMFNTSNQNYLGVEYRYLSLEASFSPVTTSAHEVGGELLFLTYAFRF